MFFITDTYVGVLYKWYLRWCIGSTRDKCLHEAFLSIVKPVLLLKKSSPDVVNF